MHEKMGKRVTRNRGRYQMAQVDGTDFTEPSRSGPESAPLPPRPNETLKRMIDDDV